MLKIRLRQEETFRQQIMRVFGDLRLSDLHSVQFVQRNGDCGIPAKTVRIQRGDDPASDPAPCPRTAGATSGAQGVGVSVAAWPKPRPDLAALWPLTKVFLNLGHYITDQFEGTRPERAKQRLWDNQAAYFMKVKFVGWVTSGLQQAFGAGEDVPFWNEQTARSPLVDIEGLVRSEEAHPNDPEAKLTLGESVETEAAGRDDEEDGDEATPCGWYMHART